MASTNPTLAEVIDLFISSHMAGVHVSLPGTVQAYDELEQTVDVQPAVKNVYTDEDGVEVVESLPLLAGVPVAFPRGGGFFVSFPIKKGDSILLVCSERSIDQWYGKGEEADPGDLRRHSLSDAVAIPGVYPSTAPLQSAHAENMVMGKDDGSQIHIKANGEVHIGAGKDGNAADFVALAAKVDAFQNSVTSYMKAMDTVLKGAPILEPGNGAASLLQATLALALLAFNAPTAQGVGATKVKAT